MEKSNMFTINAKDIGKGLIVAILTGAFLPLSLIIQEPSFNIATANWDIIFSVAMNGAVVGLVSYLTKNFFSDSEGRVFGKIG